MAENPQTIRPEDYRESLERLNRFAYLTDSCFRIPFTGIRFGLSPLVGLVPVVGDLLGLALSWYVIREASRLRAPRLMRMRMIIYALLEAVLGIVPFVGDAFDVWFKVNTRNFNMLTGYLHEQLEPPEQGGIGLFWMTLAVMVLMVFMGLLVLGWMAPQA